MSKYDDVQAGQQDHHPPPPQMRSFHVVSQVPPGMPVRQEPPLPCCIGFGWILFILGFFLTIPWYIGAIIFICSKIDPRERPGCIACIVGAVFATIVIIIVLANGGTLHLYY